MILSFFKGCGLALSLALAIGPQNTYVLKQGLMGRQVFLVALTCAVFDTILIMMGATGVSQLLSAIPGLMHIMKWVGVSFLVGYAFYAFKSALHPKALLLNDDTQQRSWVSTIAILFTLSFFNPHALLDTIVLIGGTVAQQPVEERMVFLSGTVFASFVWFFSLAYGAARFAPYFKSQKAWKILDVFVGFIMLIIALSLICTDPFAHACA